MELEQGSLLHTLALSTLKSVNPISFQFVEIHKLHCYDKNYVYNIISIISAIIILVMFIFAYL